MSLRTIECVSPRSSGTNSILKVSASLLADHHAGLAALQRRTQIALGLLHVADLVVADLQRPLLRQIIRFADQTVLRCVLDLGEYRGRLQAVQVRRAVRRLDRADAAPAFQRGQEQPGWHHHTGRHLPAHVERNAGADAFGINCRGEALTDRQILPMPGESRLQRLVEVGERQLVQRLRTILDTVSGESLILDDAAPLAIPARSSTVWMTTDASPVPCFVESLGLGTTYHSGWLAIAKSVSDLAAVGAEPSALTLAVEFPVDWTVDRFDAFFLGAAECARAHGTRIIGGNIKESKKPHAVSTAIGMSGPSGWLLRGKASPGSIIYVLSSRDVGAYWAGVATAVATFPAAHLAESIEYVREKALRPIAQVAAREALRRYPPSFCMDSSDGIPGCATELAKTSKASVVLDVTTRGLDAHVVAIAAAYDADPRVWALGWGSYHLVCASPAAEIGRTFTALRDSGVSAYVIGEVVEGPPQVFLNQSRTIAPLRDSALLRGEQYDEDSFGKAGYEVYAKLMMTSCLEDWATD